MRFITRTFFALLLLGAGGIGGAFSATTFKPQLQALLSNVFELVGNDTAKRVIVYYRNPMGDPDISAEPKKDSMGMDYLPVYSDELPPGSATGPDGRRIIYYKNPMGEPDVSVVPKKDSMGMDYLPVYEGEQPMAPETGSKMETPDSGKGKILFYRNPMGLPDTSPVPKKDSMGMDYIAVYEDEGASEPGTIKVSVEKVQRAGVKTEAVQLRVLNDALLVPGSVQLDEKRQHSITLRAEGFIEKVYAGATGQHVKKGESLFRFYSPQIVQAAVDYRLAVAGGEKKAGLQKLLNLGVPESYISSIPAKGGIPYSLDWPSPFDGVLMTKTVVEGARAMPGDELYRLADVSTVWVIADVPESDIGRVKIGTEAQISVRAYPGEVFTGKVSFILPELKAETRTAQVRIELPNPEHRLLHQMFADVTLVTGTNAPVLAVPASAILDSGKRQVVLLSPGEGRFKPVAIKTGRKGNDFVEVLEGVAEGDQIVTRANFLIDAESNLQSALTALVTAEGPAQ